MKKTKLEFLNEEHKGIGGLYFIFSSIISAFILTNILRMSYSSNISTIINNSAFIVATDALAVSYINYESSYETGGIAPFNYPKVGNYINCNDELRNIINNWADISEPISCTVKYIPTYDRSGRGLGSKLILKYDPIKLRNFDIKITPSVQEVVIE